MKIKKTLLMTALSLTLVAPTVLGAFNSEAQVTVNAAKKHKAKSHKAKKTTKKTKKTTKKAKNGKVKKVKKTTNTTTTTTTTNPTTTTTTQTPTTTTSTATASTPAAQPAGNSDQTAFNNAVGPLAVYANPGGQNTYIVGNGTQFNKGNYTDYRDALNALTTDMGSTDAYDNTNYGNKAVQEFQQQASQLAQAFNGRFSSYDNQVISQAASRVQQNWANSMTSSSARDQQWNNVQNLLNAISGGFSKLN
ncbi:hypothetical protein MOO44_04465 [Nicoliella spurrieriana]|uniref:Uncharacterized protein n=1 Tax=Nicoliella spurrieriana TaxID=2925830 RepID=A0A976RTT8_9LACO|nr:hypothetical protein [Nicoliella spurrieriana]UQS87411.1 hypothetical protein MOO44_04465 [Nicoliella spurrieriana]